MTNTNKGVDVVAFDPMSKDWTTKHHEAANAITVKDSGQLLVQKQSGSGYAQTIAVYAPDKWAHATVNDSDAQSHSS